MQKGGVICEAESIASKPDYDFISQGKEDASKDGEKNDVVEDMEEKCSNRREMRIGMVLRLN